MAFWERGKKEKKNIYFSHDRVDDYSWREDIKQIIKWYYEQSKSNRFETDVESNLLNCPWKKLNKYSGLKEMEYHPFFFPTNKTQGHDVLPCILPN